MFKNRPRKLVLLVVTGAFMLLLAGFDFYQQKNLIMSAVYVFAGVISISMLRKQDISDATINLQTGVINTLLFLINAVLLFQAGKKGLPYAWFAASVAAAISTFRRYRKNQAG